MKRNGKMFVCLFLFLLECVSWPEFLLLLGIQANQLDRVFQRRLWRFGHVERKPVDWIPWNGLRARLWWKEKQRQTKNALVRLCKWGLLRILGLTFRGALDLTNHWGQWLLIKDHLFVLIAAKWLTLGTDDDDDEGDVLRHLSTVKSCGHLYSCTLLPVAVTFTLCFAQHHRLVHSH